MNMETEPSVICQPEEQGSQGKIQAENIPEPENMGSWQ